MQRKMAMIVHLSHLFINKIIFKTYWNLISGIIIKLLRSKVLKFNLIEYSD